MKQQSDTLSNGIRHGFFTREGGVSTGIYSGLNCGLGSSDDPALVQKNRSRVAQDLGVSQHNLVTPYQTHSPDVAVVDASFDTSNRPQADAMVTQMPGRAIGIVTADCVPVLLHDPTSGTIGALHAGWKGTLSGIVQNTVATMVQMAGTQAFICAAIGPCIAQQSYEVGPEVLSAFLADDTGWANYFVPSDRRDHHRFDLGGVVENLLDKAGVARIDRIDHDTYVLEALYYSYRRATHRTESDYGRQLSAIVLEGEGDP